jgi:hypothetical protein
MRGRVDIDGHLDAATGRRELRGVVGEVRDGLRQADDVAVDGTGASGRSS